MHSRSVSASCRGAGSSARNGPRRAFEEVIAGIRIPRIVKDFDLTVAAVRLWLAQADTSMNGSTVTGSPSRRRPWPAASPA